MSRTTARDRAGDGRPQEQPAQDVAPTEERAAAAPESRSSDEMRLKRTGERPRSDDAPTAGAPPKPPLYKRPVFWVISTVVVIGASVGILLWWLSARWNVSTDDAFITVHYVTVSSRVAGHVQSVLVDDNQDVKQGQLLAQLDKTDFLEAVKSAQATYEQTQGQVQQARAQVEAAKANVTSTEADVAAAQASAEQAQRDLARYQQAGPQAVSQQVLTQAQATVRTTTANLQAAQARVGAAVAQVRLAQSQVSTAEAAVHKASADLENARLQLSYTDIIAAEEGQVTNRNVDPGSYISPGQALMALVPPNVWVVANFKETQLRQIESGQPATIHVDAYDIDLPGHVQSVQAGTGAAFSLLPPENATGNYVKVVQRVPVKITFDRLPERRLAPGMSVVPTVNTRPREGR
ncbi:MAG: secretion protein HlyD [Phycisphaerales bacterium]|nr:secretion protein HlyD [Phycisphaerales bacterium]